MLTLSEYCEQRELTDCLVFLSFAITYLSNQWFVDCGPSALSLVVEVTCTPKLFDMTTHRFDCLNDVSQ